ncbi:unnamed protein product, partial [marine sediment metagenome]
MKIKSVRCEVYLREPPPPPTRAVMPPPVKFVTLLASGKIPFTLLRITTDDGIEGFAFSDKDSLNETAVSEIKEVIIDRDPFDREWIWQRLWYMYGRYGVGRPPGVRAISAVDIALWDIAGKALGVPIYKLM